MSIITPSADALQGFAHRLVSDGSGLDLKLVLPGNDGTPAPAGLYATVLLTSDEQTGTPYANYTEIGDGNGMLTEGKRLRKRATFSVQFYRAGAIDAARRFDAYVFSPAARETAAQARITLEKTSPVRRLDALISDEFEERSNIDLMLLYLAGIDDTVGSFATANTQETLES